LGVQINLHNPGLILDPRHTDWKMTLISHRRETRAYPIDDYQSPSISTNYSDGLSHSHPNVTRQAHYTQLQGA
ncbi:Hypothetical predicted protein, partial [Pelobates cultripes]